MLQYIQKIYENHYKDQGYDILKNHVGKVGKNCHLRNENGNIQRYCFYFFVQNYNSIKIDQLDNHHIFPYPRMEKGIFNSFLIEFNPCYFDPNAIEIVIHFMNIK